MIIKIKKIWNALKWPILFMVVQVCILFVLCAVFQYQKTESVRRLHPEMNASETARFVETYLNTSEGSEALGQFLLDMTWVTILVNLVFFFPLLFHVYQAHRHPFPRYVSNKSKLHIIIVAISLAMAMNIILLPLKGNEVSTLDRPILLLLLSSGIIGPILEELLFRGILYDRLKKNVPYASAGIWTTVIFALCHGSILQIIYAVVLGSYFLYCYLHYDHLSASIYAHIATNVVVTLVVPLFDLLPKVNLVLLFILSVMIGYRYFQKIKKGNCIYS